MSILFIVIIWFIMGASSYIYMKYEESGTVKIDNHEEIISLAFFAICGVMSFLIVMIVYGMLHIFGDDDF